MARRKKLGGKCIYCFAEIVEENYAPDHLFPETFGCTREYMLPEVCANCNHTFGRTIEQIFCQDSIEAIARSQFLGKPLGTRHKMYRVRMEVDHDQRAGNLAFTQVRPDPEHIGELQQVRPQLLIDRPDGMKLSFTRHMLTKSDYREMVKSLRGNKAAIIADSEEQAYEFVGWLASEGLVQEEFGKSGTADKLAKGASQKVGVHFSGIIDHDIMRAIAKILFNYAAWVLGPANLLSSEFDAIRNYIRFQQGDGFVHSSDHKTGFLDNDGNRFPSYLFALSRGDAGLVGHLQVFDCNGYMVQLAEGHSMNVELPKGHVFNCTTRKLMPVRFEPPAMTPEQRERLAHRIFPPKR